MEPEPERRGPGRPPAASREDVEKIALTLMLRDGYEKVSVDAIAVAAGIGRTTFFRYFGSKPGVIWAAFDANITWLDAAINSARSSDATLDVLRDGIVSSTRSAIYDSHVWLERFRLFDDHPALRADAYDHWERWKHVVAVFVAERMRAQPGDAIPMAIAGACQGVFLAELRSWQNDDENREALLVRLDENLRVMAGSFEGLLRR